MMLSVVTFHIGLFFMKTILVCAILAIAVSIQAQTRITGKVIDARDGELLPRVTVKVSEKRTAEHDAEHSAGTFTDSLGKFSLEAPHKGMFDLSVKMVGYSEKIISIDIRDDDYTLGDIELHLEEMNEEVVVHSERYFTVIEDACCNVEAINREFTDLAPFSPSPTQLLRRYSSCTSSQINCSIDNSSSVRLRGLNGSRILLYLDGMPLFGALTSMYALQQIPSTAIANMRIYEGVSSVQYGNGAISGVVDFETKPPAEPNEFNFITNIGSPMDGFGIGQRDVSASYVGAIGEEIGVAGFISYNGHDLERESSSFSSTPSYDRLSGFLKSRFPLSNSARLTIGVLGAKENRFGGEDDSLSGHYAEDISTSRIDAYTKLDLNISESANLFASVMYSNAKQNSSYGLLPFDAKQDIFYGNVQIMHIN
jgi:outer membrane receptor for ferrienterochelin and colicins